MSSTTVCTPTSWEMLQKHSSKAVKESQLFQGQNVLPVVGLIQSCWYRRMSPGQAEDTNTQTVHGQGH